MEVDPATGSTALLEQEEKNDKEPMAPEVIVPAAVLQETEKNVVETQLSDEEYSPKEKALEPLSQNPAEGVQAKEIEGQTSAPVPSATEKVKVPCAQPCNRAY